MEKYDGVFKKYYKGLKSLIMKEGAAQLLVGLFSTLAHAALFVFIAYRVIYGGSGEIGDYSLYSGALTSISGYVSTLLTSTATIYEGTLFINNMMEFMSEERKIVASEEKALIPARGVAHKIEFVGVSFKYPGTERYVLKDISLTLSGYERVVLVGLNGAGKTTLIKLLTRLYDPTEGKILLDGEDIRKYSPEALYSIFGIVFQDFGKYSQTVRDNIKFGDINRKEEEGEVALSAKRADADGFIEKLPLGYETPLTRVFEEDGIELSGGQWQRLSVARAFYKESEILILDEPTASLDAIAEREVFDRFYELSANRMSIFVSHRLSSAVGADKIIVIGDGKIVEMGNHEQLMAAGGEYYRLFSTQAENYRK
jgi:ABC-type multidrug transport system fused ATPase/permease subunit